MFGWAGRRLRVDLNSGLTSIETIAEHTLANYLGGRGLNSKVILDEVSPGTDPLGPDNVLAIGIGPFNGTIVPTSGKLTISAKSPLTGIFGDSNTGGYFGSELKFAGFDQIVITGRSSTPAYLYIKDDHVQVRDASHLWGKNTWETERMIKEELGDERVEVLSIGQAGENLVRFAGVVNNMGRIAARAGMGAVMGSKKLKAIAVRGTGSVEVAYPDKFAEACYKAHDKIKSASFYKPLHTSGTLFLLRHTNEVGRLNTRNSQQGWFEGIETLNAELFHAQYKIKNRGCASCPILCGHAYHIKKDGRRLVGNAAEYENIAALGAMCGNADLKTALLASTLCDQYGLDTISTGSVIAFAMELWQRGMLPGEDIKGLDLSWGHQDTIISLVNQIALREGFGDILAEGVQKVAEKYPGSEQFAMVIKGMPTNVGDYRSTKGGALAQAVSTRGADHLRGSPVLEYLGITPEESEAIFGNIIGKDKARSVVDYRNYYGKGSLVAWSENFMAVVDSAEFCKAASYWASLDFLGPSDVQAMLNSLTGFNFSESDLFKIGERIYNIEKIFNVREGMRRKDDTLPVRWFTEKQPAGPSKGELIEAGKFEEMLDEYYEFRGWDKEGIPTKAKLQELGLQDYAPDQN